MADTIAQMRADILSVLNLLDANGNIGIIHDYERWALHYDKVLEILIDPTDNVVRSWMIVYRGFLSDDEASFFSQDALNVKGLSIRSHNWTVRGVLALDDSAATDKTFATLCQTLSNDLDADGNLHDQVRYWGDPPMSPVDLETFEVRSMAGVLVHFAEIVFTLTAVHIGTDRVPA